MALWPLSAQCLFAAEARPKHNPNQVICDGWSSDTRCNSCTAGVALLWWHSDGSHGQLTAHSYPVQSAVGGRGRSSSSLASASILPSWLCFSQLAYQGRWLPAEPQANRQMGSPQLRTKSKTLLTLPVFLAGVGQKNFSVASIPASTWSKLEPMQILDFLICLQTQHQVGSLHSKMNLNYS